MKNVLKIDFAKKQIIMDRTFAKNSTDTRSEEYAHLQRVRADYPNFTVTTRSCKPNPEKESYRGLTYAYMEDYIISTESKDTVLEVLDEYNRLRLIAECHSKSRRYPAIKRWFLARYPEVAEFGLLKVPMPTAEKPAMRVLNNSQELAPTGTEG